MASPSFSGIEAKSGISRGTLPEPFLVSLYRALAPYRGCGHGCAYCDGRAEKYFVEGIFDREIGVRFNLAERIRDDIGRGVAAKEYGAVAIGSGVTDVYQGYEGRFALTRSALEALLPSAQPIVILTKNDRIFRDFDLLSRFPQALVILTITTLDARKASLLEPGASTPARRLEAVKRAREAGFRSGVMAMPLCPGITDGEDEVRALVRECAAAGAEFVYPGGLTLRPGRQKDHFFALLAREWPGLMSTYRDLYGENRPSGAPLRQASRELEGRLSAILREEAMPAMIPHGVYRDLLSVPDALFVLLCHMQSLYAERGVDTGPLKAATERYGGWLAEERKALRRKRLPEGSRNAESAGLFGDLNQDGPTGDPEASGIPKAGRFPITEALEGRLRERPFADVCGNERLGALMDRLISENGVFDYPTLSLKRPDGSSIS